VGDPWYTSGAHDWKGAAATLNNRPIMSNKIPTSVVKGMFSIPMKEIAIVVS